MTTELHAALAAREKLQAADSALARAKEAATNAEQEVARLADAEQAWIARHQQRLAAWIAAGSSGNQPVLVADAKAQLAKATADAAARAASAALASFEQQHTTAINELKRAERAVCAAARAESHAEIRARIERCKALAAAWLAAREESFGDYLACPDAATDREWASLDKPSGYHSAAAMAIGMPPIGVSIYAADAFGGDPKPARARVDEAQRRCGQRLAELERGEGIEPAPRVEAA
jgi:hypothetical protein